MEIYEKNLAALKKGQPQINLDEGNEREAGVDDYTFRIELAMNDQRYPVVETSQGVWQLNGRYNPEQAALVYANRYQKLQSYESIVVFGLSDGRALRQMLSYGDETNFWIVYEPSREWFYLAIKEFDLSDIFFHEQVYLVVESGEDLKNILKNSINYNNRFLIQHCILPGYDVLYHEKCQKMINEMVMQVEYSQIIKNTVKEFHREFARAGIQCMEDALYQSNIYQMREYFQKKDICDVPVIIVAAGPSLNKNIEILKRAKGKAFLMVVDAALRAMSAHEITPDLALSVDARVRDDFFADVDIQGIPFYFSCSSKQQLISSHKGRHFYDLAPNDLFDSLAKEVSDNEFVSLGSGGSVSTVAFSLALYLGFRTIVFVGQDLAFTGGQSYNKSLVKDEQSNQRYIDSRVRVWAEDYEGNPVETDYQMNMYRLWLEKEIADLPQEYRIIDATEGGARISGTKILSLKDTIDNYCERDVDFAKLLQEVPLAYDEEQRRHIWENIRKEPQRLREIASVVEKGMESARELSQANVRQDGKAQKRLLEELKEINEKILSEPIQDLLLYYNSQAEYGVGEDIFTGDFTVPQLCEKFLQWYEACKPALMAIADDIEQAL
ncbi:MAG: DUF115 domain-containing protein [Lachnospiraceae bacterium]|nr:DUF115 domain-containing protein [Lachnospiraceae bacterium]